MIIFKKSADLSIFLSNNIGTAHPVGFIPTMGALHEGHISLITNSASRDNLTICSIFINPTQFNNPIDLNIYPVTLESDIEKLSKTGCDILFLPLIEEIYPAGIKELEKYELGYLGSILEGQYRPGHFQGVCQVMHRLLKVIAPENLYLGQKDYQQCLVIKKLIELTNLSVNVIIYPTQRESDGLAMSSRNMRLNKKERSQAVKIYETLCFMKKELKYGHLEDLKERAKNYLEVEGFNVDYTEIADSITLQLVNTWNDKTKLVALIAASINDTRLIDNLLLNN